MPKFNKATKAIRKNLAEREQKSHSLNDFIADAIDVYIYEKKASTERVETMRKIAQILNEKVNNEPIEDDEKIFKIQNLIWGENANYYRGGLGRSYLADCIQAALYLYQSQQLEIVRRKNLQFSRNQPGFKVHPQAIISAYEAFRAQIGEQRIQEKINADPQTDLGKKYAEMKAIYDAAIRNDDPAVFIRVELTANEKDKKDPIRKFLENIKKEAAIIHSAKTTRIETKEETSEYTLAHYLLFAIQEFQDRNLTISDETLAKIKELQKFIEENKNVSDGPLFKYVMNFFNIAQFQGDKELKSLLLKSRAQFIKMASYGDHHFTDDDDRLHVKRKRMLKIWRSTKQHESPRNVMLAIHGLGDSLTTWEGQIKKWNAAGYDVISYDHVGHGFDPLRRHKEPLNIRQMRYDFYDQLTRLQEDPQIGEIHLEGHSLGGALLLNCYGTIQENLRSMSSVHAVENEQNPENQEVEQANKVVTMTCIAPSIMKNAWSDSISVFPTHLVDEGNKEPPVKALRDQLGSSRIGGASPFSNLKDFIETLANGFKNLHKVLTRKYVHDPEKEPVKCLIIATEQDKLVPVENIRRMNSIFTDTFRKKELPVRFKIFKNVGHHLHALGSQTSHIVQNVTLEHAKTASEARKQKRQDVQPQYLIRLQ